MLVEIGGNQLILMFKCEGGFFEVKLLVENLEVVISGIQDVLLLDLIIDVMNGDQVELMLNGEDCVI